LNTQPEWSLSGDCVEACTSPAVCPYYWGSSAPTDLHGGKDQCEGAFTFRIRRGYYEQEDLSGLLAGYGFNTGVGGPGSGDPWKAILYIDDTASEAQHECLRTILSTCWGLAGEVLKVKRASMVFTKEQAGSSPACGYRHSVQWKGIYTMKAVPITARDGMARYISGMTNAIIYVGRTTQNTFGDPDLPRGAWDSPGMSNTYFDFSINPSSVDWVP
jgi:hypothetical protein